MFADITSANVVGYKNHDLQFGTTIVAPCFVDVGGTDAVDLTKIAPGGDFASGEIQISRLDSAGRNIEDYSYDVPRRGTPGWYNMDSGDAVREGDVVFAAGEGIAVTGNDGLNITSSGEVSTTDRVIALQFGTTLCGNHTAIGLDITSIIPGGDYASGEIQISRLDSAGRNIEDYSFDVPRRGTPGWYNMDTGDAMAEGDLVFEPGEGFAVTGNDGLTITILGPTL